MTYQASTLVRSFAESATLLIGARAKKLAAEGKNIINFGLGEPDFKTPEDISEAGYAAAKAGQTKYTPVAGTAELREAVAKRISEDYGVPYRSDEVIISTGGKQAIFHFLQALIEPGDEVLIPVPYWTSFPEMVKMVGGVPRFVKNSSGRLQAADLEAALTPKTKLLIFNSPSNPSGLCYSPEELKELFVPIQKHGAWVMSDDTYYQLVYSPHTWQSVVKLFPDLRKRTCIIGSMSKSYAMTGWRVGWALGPKELIDAMTKIQSQVTSGASSIGQAASVYALGAGHRWAAEFRSRYEKRRAAALEALSKVSGIVCPEPEGAFYCFFDLSERIHPSQVTSFCQNLLENHGVCLIPGEAFGLPGSTRMTYSLSEESIQEGIRRISKALESQK